MSDRRCPSCTSSLPRLASATRSAWTPPPSAPRSLSRRGFSLSGSPRTSRSSRRGCGRSTSRRATPGATRTRQKGPRRVGASWRVLWSGLKTRLETLAAASRARRTNGRLRDLQRTWRGRTRCCRGSWRTTSRGAGTRHQKFLLSWLSSSGKVSIRARARALFHCIIIGLQWLRSAINARRDRGGGGNGGRGAGPALHDAGAVPAAR